MYKAAINTQVVFIFWSNRNPVQLRSSIFRNLIMMQQNATFYGFARSVQKMVVVASRVVNYNGRSLTTWFRKSSHGQRSRSESLRMPAVQSHGFATSYCRAHKWKLKSAHYYNKMLKRWRTKENTIKLQTTLSTFK